MGVGGVVARLACTGLLVASVTRPTWAAATTTPSTTPATTPSTTLGASAGPGVVTIEGRGFGHGVGLAQDGAFWLGKMGRSSTQILATFFPGTTLSRQVGTVRVPLTSLSRATVTLAGGGSVNGRTVPRGSVVDIRAAGGTGTATVRPAKAADVIDSTDPGASATDTAAPDPGVGIPVAMIGPASVLRLVGVVRTQEELIPTSTPPVPTTVAPTTSPPTNLEATTTISPAPTGETPTTVAAAEGPATTTTEAAQSDDATNAATSTGGFTVSGAQIEVAGIPTSAFNAKRYRGTLRFNAAGGSMRVVNELDVEDYLRGMGEILYRDWPAAAYEAQAIVARTYALRMMATNGQVCPTQACQVYFGAQVEFAQMDAAVAATRGKVVTYKGSLAATYYSASGGGTIATPLEAFGNPGKNVPYLRAGYYPAGSVMPWTVVSRLAEIGRRVGYRGTAQSVTVTKTGPSGRAIEVTVDGSSGPLRVRGPAFDAAMGLKSTFFTIRSGGSLEQALADEKTLPDSVAVDGATNLFAGAALDLDAVLPVTASVDTTIPVSETTAVAIPDSTPDTAAVDGTPTSTVVAETAATAATPADGARVTVDDGDTDAATYLLCGAGGVLVAGLVARFRRRR